MDAPTSPIGQFFYWCASLLVSSSRLLAMGDVSGDVSVADSESFMCLLKFRAEARSGGGRAPVPRCGLRASLQKKENDRVLKRLELANWRRVKKA